MSLGWVPPKPRILGQCERAILHWNTLQLIIKTLRSTLRDKKIRYLIWLFKGPTIAIGCPVFALECTKLDSPFLPTPTYCNTPAVYITMHIVCVTSCKIQWSQDEARWSNEAKIDDKTLWADLIFCRIIYFPTSRSGGVKSYNLKGLSHKQSFWSKGSTKTLNLKNMVNGVNMEP